MPSSSVAAFCGATACAIAVRRANEESEARRRREEEGRKSEDFCKCRYNTPKEFSESESKYLKEQRLLHEENLRAHQRQMLQVSNIIVGTSLVLMVVVVLYMFWKERKKI